jgi:hypothetical protein
MPKPKKGSAKKPVIEHLYDRWRKGEFPEGIIHRTDITQAIASTGSGLSVGNAANFLKDLIRKKSIVENWPISLTSTRISARQRYGDERVFQFFEHPAEWDSPFPDWHAPDAQTPIYTVQSVSIDSLARSLGRSEESWLTQIAVNLHLVHTQLSIYSPDPLRKRIRDVRHLQMGIKTQPEIDAAFVATYKIGKVVGSAENIFVTVEAKQRDERILLDQIREQVSKAFQITRHLNDPPVHGVKPMALQVVRWPFNGNAENMIFLVEFQHIEREHFEANYSSTVDPLAIYSMQLEQVAAVLYRLEPPIKALG